MSQNYYVSSSIGKDQNNGTSAATPFASLQKAADAVGSGDTVFVMPGNYGNPDPEQYILNITKSGTAAAPITFKAFDPNNRPVVNVRNYVGIQVLGSHVNIDGFVVSGNRSEFEKMSVAEVEAFQQKNGRFNPITSGFGITIGSLYARQFATNVNITNSVVRDNTGSGISVFRGDYITVENNQVYRNALYTPYAASGISFYQSANSDDNTGVKMIVRGNTIYENQNLIKNYINFDEADINSPDPYKRPRITDGNGIIIDDGARTQRQDVDGTQPIKDLPAYKGKTLIENNNVFNNGGRGIHVFESSNVDIRNNKVSNNVLSPEITGRGEITSYVSEEAKAKGAGQGISITGDDVFSAAGLPTKAIFDSENSRPTVKLRGTSNAESLIPETLPDGQSYKYVQIFGEGGNDTLTGSNTTDTNNLFGDAGDDIINAGKASTNNYIVGGTGNDTLNFDVARTVMDIAVYNSGDGRDTITGFTRGIGNDQIFFNGISNIDVVSRNGSTELRIGDGVAGNGGFASGRMLVKVLGTTGFNANDVGVNLFDSSFKFS